MNLVERIFGNYENVTISDLWMKADYDHNGAPFIDVEMTCNGREYQFRIPAQDHFGRTYVGSNDVSLYCQFPKSGLTIRGRATEEWLKSKESLGMIATAILHRS